MRAALRRKTIMATYQRCPPEIEHRASKIMRNFVTYEPVLEAKVKIDFIFASGDRDESGELQGDAITKNGVRAFGLCKAIGTKDRAMGRADVEIMIDRDWWDTHDEPMQDALLDHELHHIVPREKNGSFVMDDLGRPKLKMREHDYEFGWFTIIARRHAVSVERTQARSIYDFAGQAYWPFLYETAADEQTRFSRVAQEMAGEVAKEETTVSISVEGKPTGVQNMPLSQFSKGVEKLRKRKGISAK